MCRRRRTWECGSCKSNGHVAYFDDREHNDDNDNAERKSVRNVTMRAEKSVYILASEDNDDGDMLVRKLNVKLRTVSKNMTDVDCELLPGDSPPGVRKPEHWLRSKGQ